MPIEVSYDSAESAPEEIRAHLKKNEAGKFVGTVVPAAKLDEFRDTNIAVRKENETLKQFRERVAPIIGDDIEKFNTDFSSLQELRKKFENKELVENSSFEEALAKRTEEMKRDSTHQIATLTDLHKKAEAEKGTLQGRINTMIVDRYVGDAALHKDSGAYPEALNDILVHARDIFKVDKDGNVIPVDKDGAKLYGVDGTSLLTPKEWLGKLRTERPYFFRNSNGGGATGSQDARTFGVGSIENMSQEDYEKARKDGRIK